MSVAVFKPEIWSNKIQHQLETITSLRNHSDHEFEGEIKGAGTVLHIATAVRPTVGTYVPGTDINFQPVSGTSTGLEINKFKYSTVDLDDVDRAQSIKGVFEATTTEMARALADDADIEVANELKNGIENGVTYTDASDSTATATIEQEASASAVTKSNAPTRISAGLTKLYANNVKPSDTLWGEFTPTYYSALRDYCTELYTNNVDMAKRGILGKFYNVNVTMQNLLPKITSGSGSGATVTGAYNIIRTSKAVAYAEQLHKTEAGRHEKQFGDYVKALLIFGVKIVRPAEMYAIKESF